MLSFESVFSFPFGVLVVLRWASASATASPKRRGELCGLPPRLEEAAQIFESPYEGGGEIR